MAVFTLFGQPASPAAIAADATEYTLSMEFTVSQSVELTGIWFYSPPTAGSLPVACGIFQKTGPGAGSLIASNLSPSWSGAAGSGWVRCAFPGSTILSPGNVYKVSVAGANAADWYAPTNGYWTTGGAGQSGLTNGPISAPNTGGADVGQDGFFPSSQTLTYPSSTNGGANYWVDVEVTTIAQVTAKGGSVVPALVALAL